MDKQMKDVFNEIHAPKDLIEDTKKKMHNAQNADNIMKPKRPIWKAAAGIATVAACAVIIVTGKHFYEIENSESPQEDIVNIVDLTEEKDSFNGDSHNSTKEFEFEGIKSLSEWQNVLENISINDNDRIYLDENYVIFTFKYPKGEEEYQIDLLVEGGELYSENDKIILQGNFKAEVWLGEDKINETSLNINSSSQFTVNNADLEMKDINNDGSMDFLLETAYNGEQESTSGWYTLNEDGNIIESKL